jgi:hypothetical protein
MAWVTARQSKSPLAGKCIGVIHDEIHGVISERSILDAMCSREKMTRSDECRRALSQGLNEQLADFRMGIRQSSADDGLIVVLDFIGNASTSDDLEMSRYFGTLLESNAGGLE